MSELSVVQWAGSYADDRWKVDNAACSKLNYKWGVAAGKASKLGKANEKGGFYSSSVSSVFYYSMRINDSETAGRQQNKYLKIQDFWKLIDVNNQVNRVLVEVDG
jgi:hypothetical protein